MLMTGTLLRDQISVASHCVTAARGMLAAA